MPLMSVKLEYRDYITICSALQECAGENPDSPYADAMARLDKIVLVASGTEWSYLDDLDPDSDYSVWVAAIQDTALGSRKIQAIKELRLLSSLGLKEAKDAIDLAGAPRQVSTRHGYDLIMSLRSVGSLGTFKEEQRVVVDDTWAIMFRRNL